jgi:hypothetical protein
MRDHGKIVAHPLPLSGRFPLVHRNPTVLAWGFSSSGAMRYQGSEDEGCQELKENLFFQGDLCYHAVDARIRFQEQKLGGFAPGQEAPKTHF